MKTIIDGKVYDTSTAVRVGYWSNGLTFRDPDSKEETLYLKRTGEYFIYGEGGRNTNYAERIRGGWRGGVLVTPLTYEEARQWAEEHLSPDAYEIAFGVNTSEEKKTVTYSLPVAAIEKLRRKASEAGVSASTLLEQLIASLGDREK